MTAARLKASEQREKEYYSKTLEEAHGPRDAEGEPVPAEATPDVLPEAARTPVQQGGPSGSEGPPPVAGRLLPAGDGPPLPGVPVLGDQDSKKRGFAQQTAENRQVEVPSRISLASLPRR